MAGAWITVGGVWQPITSAWLTDSTGVWRPTQQTWLTSSGVWNPSGLGVSGAADVNYFTVLPEEQWNQTVVAWDVSGADKVEVYANDRLIYSGALLTHQIVATLTAGARTTFTLITVTNDISTQFGPQPFVDIGAPPAPENLRVTDTTPFTITFAWDTVPGATRYDLQLSNGTEIYSGTTASYRVSVPDAETSRTVQVRAVSGSTSSAWSASKTGVSAAATWRQGTFTLDPRAAYTYMRGKGQWRAASDGLWHGNWLDGRGAQHSGLFFASDFRDKFKADLDKGAEIVKFEIALRRKKSGPRRRIQARVHLHTRGTKPNGDITKFYVGTVDVSPTLPQEMDSTVWCELPASWARRLIRQEDGVKGLSVGMNSQERYFEMSPLTTANRVGRVRITLR